MCPLPIWATRKWRAYETTQHMGLVDGLHRMVVCVCHLAGGSENVTPLPPTQGSMSSGKTPNSSPSDVIRTLQPATFPGSEGSTRPFLLTAGTTQSSETKLEFHPFPHSPEARNTAVTQPPAPSPVDQFPSLVSHPPPTVWAGSLISTGSPGSVPWLRQPLKMACWQFDYRRPSEPAGLEIWFIIKLQGTLLQEAWRTAAATLQGSLHPTPTTCSWLPQQGSGALRDLKEFRPAQIKPVLWLLLTVWSWARNLTSLGSTFPSVKWEWK